MIGQTGELWPREWGAGMEKNRLYFSFPGQRNVTLPDGIYRVAVLAGPNLDVVGLAETRVGAGGGQAGPASEVQAVPAPTASAPGDPQIQACSGWSPQAIQNAGISLHSAVLPETGETIAYAGFFKLVRPLGSFSTFAEAEAVAGNLGGETIVPSNQDRWVVLEQNGAFHAFKATMYQRVIFEVDYEVTESGFVIQHHGGRVSANQTRRHARS